MSELVEFLRARIAEDEQVARWRLEDVAQYGQSELDPDHALLIAGAMRRIVDLHKQVPAHAEPIPEGEPRTGCAVCHCSSDGWIDAYGDCGTVCLLAAAYSDHEDYRAEWAV